MTFWFSSQSEGTAVTHVKSQSRDSIFWAWFWTRLKDGLLSLSSIRKISCRALREFHPCRMGTALSIMHLHTRNFLKQKPTLCAKKGKLLRLQPVCQKRPGLLEILSSSYGQRNVICVKCLHRCHHINVLQLLVLKHFLCLAKDQHVSIRTDRQIIAAYINRAEFTPQILCLGNIKMLLSSWNWTTRHIITQVI